ncbi:lysophospholipid acyltransferase family protein [Altererythrobacter sp. MTPC7]|nr:lysophospholipid acyltransferase family protein [Erythrobacteraceae bacterium WH01K]
MHVLRSLLFYPVFYVVSSFYVIAAVAAMAVDRSWLRRVVSGWGRFHRACCRVLLGIDVVQEGGPLDEPALYAIRHESFFEAIDAPALFHLPSVFAKRELFNLPGWGRAAIAYGLIPVARDGGAKALRELIHEARRKAKEGRPLVIFPEGTRVPHGERRKLQSGFAGIYKMVGLQVVPVAVNSGPLYHRLWKRRGQITYRFGEPIPPGLKREEIEARVEEAINALSAA